MSTVRDKQGATTAAAAFPAPVSRNVLVKRWGTPTTVVGSVNEPREMEERGHRFNEKWVYRSAGTVDAPAERVVYWLRYDVVASYLVPRSGEAVREDLR